MTDQFQALAKAQANALGFPQLPIVVIPHPLGGRKARDVEQLAYEAFKNIAAYLARDNDAGPSTETDRVVLQRFSVSVDMDEQQAFLYEKGWTDGLPVIPPTPDRVYAMLACSQRQPEEILGLIPPKWAEATVEKVAVNAVMAGCQPGYFPVILAAVEAMLDSTFNLYGVQTTTHPCTPLLIINGPVARELGINSKGNCFGQGWRANAAIGRAVRLVLQNIGGGIPGELDKATMGHPGKYSYCIAENEAENPWGPLHVERGYDAGDSTVTVVAAEAPHNINDHGSTSAEGILTTICGTVATTGHNNLYWASDCFVVLGPEHAATIAADGFTKQNIKQYIYDNGKIPVNKMSPGQLNHIKTSAPGDYEGSDGMVRFVGRIDDINIIVAGGPGKHSMWIPTFISCSVTRPVR